MSTKKRYKLLKIIGLTILGICIILFIFLGIDYNHYRNGDRSTLFNTLDTYSQDQTLKYGSLNLKVNNITLKAYPAPTKPETDCNKTSSSSSSGRTNFSQFYCDYDLNTVYPNQIKHYNNMNEIIVEFQYENISDNTINLSDYSTKLIANTPLDDYGTPSKACTGMTKSTFLKGYTEKECISRDVSKNYSGPLALTVTKAGKQKVINLSIPKVTKN